MEIWAATRDPAAAGHRVPRPYSVQTLRDELQMRPVIVADGELTEVEPLSGEAEREFPEPVGRATGIYTLHSELATLPASLPSLRDASFRLCLSSGLLEKLLALEDGELPEPYVQSEESVAVHEVELADERVQARRDGGHARWKREVDLRARGARCARDRRGQALRAGRQAARACDRGAGSVSRAAVHGGALAEFVICHEVVTDGSQLSELCCLSWQRRLQHLGARRRWSKS